MLESPKGKKMINNKRPETDLSTHDFFYELPEELIAQTPAEPRDSSRLMVLDKGNGEIEHRRFSDITEYLREGDTLVINDSKVIPARLFGAAEDKPDRMIEFLLLRNISGNTWESLARPGKKARIGRRFVFGDGILKCTVIDIKDDGNRVLEFEYDDPAGFYAVLDKVGTMPLPPYILTQWKDNSRYQTVYANERGSAAAPTAGLHFTPELLEKIKAMGVEIVPVMLHIGLGTFRPVKEDKIADHIMHTEFITVTQEAADKINARRAAGGRVICVGTTSCRTLESASDDTGKVNAVIGDTGIFIYPGYKFKVCDALITNFHLPESTLIMLVSALAGKEKTLAAYECAVKEKYRFFSFGDAMFIQ